MAQRELQIVTSLKDNASKQLKGLQGKLDKMKPQFRKMAMVGTAALGGITYGLKQAVDSAGMAEGAYNKFNTVFAGSEDEMQSWLDQMRGNMPAARHEIARMTAGVGDLLKPMGIGQEEASQMSMEAVELADKIAAFNDVNPEKVLNAMKSGFVGSSEPLRQFGVDARVTALESVALKEGIIQAEESFATMAPEARSAAQAEALMIQMTKQSKDAIAGYNKNQDSYIRKKQEMSAQIKDVSVKLGQTFIPMLSDLLEKINPIIESIGEWIKENPKLVKNIIIVTGIITGLTIAVGLLGLAMSAVSLPLLLIVGLIVGLGYVIIKSGKKISNFVSSILESEFMQALKILADRYLTSLRQGLTTLWENLKELWNFIKPVLIPILKILGKILGLVIVGAIMAVLALFRGLIGIFGIVVKVIKKFIEAAINMANDWVEGVKMMVNSFKEDFNKFKEFFGNLLEGLSNVWSSVWESMKDFFVGIWDGIKEKVNSVVNWVKDKIQGVKDIIGGIGDVFGGIGSAIGGAARSVVGVNDALITKGGKIVKFNPNDNLLAFQGKGVGGNVSININAPVYGMDEEDVAEKLGNKIISQLNLSKKL